jgi:hypothetical protein
MASSLVDAAKAAAARFPLREPAGPEEEMLEPVGSHEDGDDESRAEGAERTASRQDT